MSRTASVETVNREERSCVHPTPKMIDPKKNEFVRKKILQKHRSGKRLLLSADLLSP